MAQQYQRHSATFQVAARHQSLSSSHPQQEQTEQLLPRDCLALTLAERLADHSALPCPNVQLVTEAIQKPCGGNDETQNDTSCGSAADDRSIVGSRVRRHLNIH